jgi:hypothetical protein
MNRQHRFTGSTSILCFFFALFIGANTLITPTVTATANPFEDMFKDFDFNKFVNELEKELKNIEAQENDSLSDVAEYAAPNNQAQPNPFAVNPKKSEAKSTSQEPQNISTDPTELFLNPPVKKIKQDSREVSLPIPQAFNACETLLAQLNQLIGDIDRKVTSQTTFSSEFFEYYQNNYGDMLDSIRVSLGIIMGKKAYRLVLLTPQNATDVSKAKGLSKPAAGLDDKMKAIRQAVIAKIKDLKALNTAIDGALANEETSEIALIKKLREDAQDSTIDHAQSSTTPPTPRLKRLHFDDSQQISETETENAPQPAQNIDAQTAPQAPTPAYLQQSPLGLPGIAGTAFDGF